MSDLAQGNNDSGDDVVNIDAHDESLTPGNGGLSDEDMARATRQGWAPKDQWKGPEDQWVDAKTFLKRGDEILPIVKANNRKLEEEIKALKEARERDQETFEAFKKFQQEARERSEREFKQQLNDIKARKAQAVRDGDSDAFTAAEDAEDQLREEREKAKSEEKQQKQEAKKKNDQPPQHPDFQPWLDQNTWYKDSRAGRALADAIGQELSQTTQLTGKAFFDAVAAEVQKEMPDLFENTRRSRANSVESASNSGRRSKGGGKSYSDLPPEAKKACDEFVQTIPGYTKEQYLKDYSWE